MCPKYPLTSQWKVGMTNHPGWLLYNSEYNRCQPRLLYLPKLSHNKGRMKIFHIKDKLQQFLWSNPTQQKILRENFSLNARLPTSKKAQGTINLRTVNQKRKKCSNHKIIWVAKHYPIITLNVNKINNVNASIKRHRITKST